MNEDQRLCNNLGLKQSALNQLRAYIAWAEDSGAYYGRKEYFTARHVKIKKALNIPENKKSNPADALDAEGQGTKITRPVAARVIR